MSYPDEVLERVARGIFTGIMYGGTDWEWEQMSHDEPGSLKRLLLCVAQDALNALGIAEVWDAGYDVGQDDCRDGGRGETNPYREGPRDRD